MSKSQSKQTVENPSGYNGEKALAFLEIKCLSIGKTFDEMADSLGTSAAKLKKKLLSDDVTIDLISKIQEYLDLSSAEYYAAFFPKSRRENFNWA